ncbi:MAG: hypothetical protein C4547_12865 [Phycisphaerales bacterium]|nr:MAG: hypothetical protein C4547_12865 [Phycisphaerales bacterium]
MEGAITHDPANLDMTFSTNRGNVGNHPIMSKAVAEGDAASIRVFGFGQSMSVPKGATALLKLSDTAVDSVRKDVEGVPGADFDWIEQAARGRAMAVAFTFGSGRVVMVGNADMLTARHTKEFEPFGMNAPSNRNREFLIGIMRWLAEPDR